MVLDLIQKRSLFKALATKPQLEVGKEFGFNKQYKNESTIRMKVNQIYREVLDNPSLFAVEPEMARMVQDAMESRRATKKITTVDEEIKLDEKALVVGAGKKAWILLNKKLDQLAKNKKLFEGESIMNLAKIAGIAFDKSQIVKGEATENISLRAHIDKDITPEQAVEQLLRFRENQQAE